MSASEAYPHQDAPSSIFLRFLKFGALAWGGPAAQIAMIKRECVDEEGWISEATFKKTLAVYQILPMNGRLVPLRELQKAAGHSN